MKLLLNSFSFAPLLVEITRPINILLSVQDLYFWRVHPTVEAPCV